MVLVNSRDICKPLFWKAFCKSYRVLLVSGTCWRGFLPLQSTFDFEWSIVGLSFMKKEITRRLISVFLIYLIFRFPLHNQAKVRWDVMRLSSILMHRFRSFWPNDLHWMRGEFPRNSIMMQTIESQIRVRRSFLEVARERNMGPGTLTIFSKLLPKICGGVA